MDSTTGAPAGPTAGPSQSPRWWTTPKWRAFIATAASFITIVFSMSMSFVVLASIAETFDVTLRAVGWVVIIEALIISALLLPMGGISDSIGRRRVLIAGLGVFGAGSVFTGLAPTFAVLIVARVVMAFGNAMAQSVATGILVAAFPPGERGRAVGAQSTAVAVGGAAGPLVGGLALEAVPWQLLFVGLAVPVAISIAAAVAFLDDDRNAGDHQRPAFDWMGGLLSALTIVVLVLTISNPFAMAWSSPVIVAGAAAFIVLLASFVWWELRQSEPMLDLRLFALSVFSTAVMIRVLGFAGATVTTFLLPVYLLSVRELAAGATGTIIFLAAVGMGTASQLSGRLYDRVGPRLPTILGLVLQAATAAALAFTHGSTPLEVVAPIVLVSGLSIGLWNVPNNSAMLGATPRASLGVGGAFSNVTRTVGTVLGQAMASAIVVGVMAARGFDIPLGDVAETSGAPSAFVDGWQAAYLGVAALAIVALALAVRLPGRTEID